MNVTEWLWGARYAPADAGAGGAADANGGSGGDGGAKDASAGGADAGATGGEGGAGIPGSRDLFGDGGRKAEGSEGAADQGKALDGEGANGAYRPSGVPDNLVGKTDKETIDLLANAHKGALAAMSKNKAGIVPESADGYVVEAKGEDGDNIAEFINGPEFAPILSVARTAAKEAGIPQEQFETFMRHAAENGVDPMFLMSDEEATRVSYDAERTALIERVGSEEQAQAVIEDVFRQVTPLVESGVLSSELVESTAPDGSKIMVEKPGTDMHEFRMMVGTAEGMMVMQRILSSFTGRPIVPVVTTAGQTARADAEAAMDAALAMPQGSPQERAARERAIETAQANMEKTYARPGARA